MPQTKKVNPIQVQKFLKGMDYPVTKQDIVKAARSNKADREVLESLEQLPEREYQTPAEISKELGKIE